jgi:hypothetical protein
MKLVLNILMTAFQILGCTEACFGEPASRSTVPLEAVWAIHFDAEHFRTTALGRYYTNKVLPVQLRDAQEKHKFDLGPLFRGLKSATAFGVKFDSGSEKTGVLLLKSDPGAVKGVHDFLFKQSRQTNPEIQQVQSKPFVIFKIDSDTFAAPLTQGNVCVSKSQKHLSMACEVLAGERPTLAGGTNFTDWGSDRQPDVLIAVAGSKSGMSGLPSNARILQKAQSLKLNIQENNDQLILGAVIQTESPETASQLRQIANGILGWTALDKGNEGNLHTSFLNSAKLNVSGENLKASFSIPVKMVIQELEKELKKSKK